MLLYPYQIILSHLPDIYPWERLKNSSTLEDSDVRIMFKRDIIMICIISEDSSSSRSIFNYEIKVINGEPESIHYLCADERDTSISRDHSLSLLGKTHDAKQ